MTMDDATAAATVFREGLIMTATVAEMGLPGKKEANGRAHGVPQRIGCNVQEFASVPVLTRASDDRTMRGNSAFTRSGRWL
jgi:hypothetical protein